MNEKLLLEIARTAIKSKFDNNTKIQKTELLEKFPFLDEQRACFVTLTLEGKLRGCIGSLQAHRSLMDDLIYNSIAASFSDPRFSPLTLEEFQRIKIEISLLTKPEILKYDSFQDLEKKLIPNKHGVILELDGKRATFLPQVWEQLTTFNEFMVHLCKKAGLQPNNLSGLPKIQVYEAIKIKE